MKRKLIRVGTAADSLQFLEGQLSYYNREFEVVAVASGKEKLEEVGRTEGIRTHEIVMSRPIDLIQDIKSLVNMIRFLSKEKPLIIHSMTPKAGLISMVGGWISGVPVRIHTYTGLIFPTATGLKQKILILMDRLLCLCATRIIPEGKGVKNDLISYKITNKPLNVLLNGSIKGLNSERFDPDLYTKEDHEILRYKLGINPNDYVFLFIGRINRDKGINELIWAFRHIQEKRPVKLVLVGPTESDQNPILPETSLEIQKGEGIIAVGSQSDVRPFYALSDALVFPSYREGFPNVPLEAGAMGLPCIVTDINGSNEIIIEGKNGTIIPPRDQEALLEAMERFAEDSEYVKELSENARGFITSRYNNKEIWDATLSIYNEEIQRITRI